MTTLRKNAKNLPNKEDLENSSKHYAFSNENNCFIQIYKDKKDVYFASNFKQNIEDIKDYYNEKNRGVDIMDQYISYYNIERRSIKWWKKVFFFGIEVCINNSYILYKQNNNNNNRKYDFLTFRLNLIKQILNKYTAKEYNFENIKKNNAVNNLRIKFFKNCIHYPKKIKGLKKNCFYCYKEDKLQKQTNFYCEKCDKVLHLECFVVYHNKYVYI